MVKLVERALVKDLLKMARADSLHDEILNNMIEQCSAEVERLTRREFEKKERTEYHTSYEQTASDPDPQFVLLNAYPVDREQNFQMWWSAYDHRENLAIEMTEQEENFILDPVKGMITVRSAGSMIANLPIIGNIAFSYAPRGFKILYTGGYPVNVKPEEEDEDPMDDYGVVQVPYGLKILVAQKVAKDFRDTRVLLPFTDEERKGLKPWNKKDMI